MSAQALEVDDVTIAYGHVVAVSGVSLSLSTGETVAVLGPNGAGKTTLLRTIAGQLRAASGDVRLFSESIASSRPDRIVRKGLIHVPEGRHMVSPLTVRENLQLAGLASRRCPKKELGSAIESVFEMFPILYERRRLASGQLSGGEQQMLAIGRAIVSRPKVLLLDEPSMGLAPIVVDLIYAFLAKRDEHLPEVAILLAEQNRVALDVADRVCILARGKSTFVGPDISREAVIERYLGQPAAPASTENVAHQEPEELVERKS